MFSRANGICTESAGPVALGHEHGVGIRQKPTVANLALTADGKTLVAADIYNDAISIVDVASRAKVGELDLRPGILNAAQSGVAGGESPFGVAIKGNETTYVSSERDREIDVVDISSPAAPKLRTRIPVNGNPNSMVLNAAQTRLFSSVLALVGRHKLTAYDASCLEPAIRRDLPIAALDNALTKAARESGVTLVQI